MERLLPEGLVVDAAWLEKQGVLAGIAEPVCFERAACQSGAQCVLVAAGEAAGA